MENTEIFDRVAPQLKKRATKVFRKIGISFSEAINMFLKEVIAQQGLPFERRIPNKETTETMKKTDAGEELTEYDNVNDFYREMGI